MSAYKSRSHQVMPEVDPVAAVKHSQTARAEKIQQRSRIVVGTAVAGIIILIWLNFVITPHIYVKSLRDISFLQRFSLLWLGQIFACIPILMLSRFRMKYPFLLSTKAQTPSILMMVIGLGILLYVAADFFSRPYTGASLNHTTEGGYFAIGWFLIFFGIVFRK